MRIVSSLTEEDAGPNALNSLCGIEQLDNVVGCIDNTYHARQHYTNLALYFDAIPHPDLVWNTQSDYEAALKSIESLVN
jgi:hypothetical protein